MNQIFRVEENKLKYIIVRTYGNGKHMNKVLPMSFEYLSLTDKIIAILNEKDCDSFEKWIAIPIVDYKGDTW